MKALIFAAGKGKRMLPLTEHTPKPLLTVLGKPLLGYIIDSLPDEIQEIVMVVGYKAGMIQEYMARTHPERTVTYVMQNEQNGTGGALMLCQPSLAEGERFLLMFADDIYDKESITKCLDYPLSMLVAEVADPRRYGVIELDAEQTVVGIEEKPESPKSNFVAPGAYVLDTRIFTYPQKLQPNGEYYLTTMLEHLIKDAAVRAVPCKSWLTFAAPDDLAIAEGILIGENAQP